MTKLTLMNKLAKLTELFEKNDNGEPKVIVYPQENPFRGSNGFTKLTQLYKFGGFDYNFKENISY